MARVRSPNYPAHSLGEMITRVSQVFGREHKHLAAKDVVVKGMGYSGINGASLGALSAGLKYGLLERDGEDYRVTDLAVAIIHPTSPGDRVDAIRQAAESPVLFKELLDQFKGTLPSDDNLKAYLVRRGFSQTALNSVIKPFRDTMDLVSTESRQYSPAKSPAGPTGPGTGTVSIGPAMTLSPQGTFMGPASNVYVGHPYDSPPGTPFRLSVMTDCIGVEAMLVDQASVDRLINALRANKDFLPKSVESIEDRGNSEDDEAAN